MENKSFPLTFPRNFYIFLPKFWVANSPIHDFPFVSKVVGHNRSPFYIKGNLYSMDTNPAKILYVEDEESFANVVKFALEDHHGHSVDVAETGEEGIEKLKTNHYDLVFLDYLLPGITGLDVLRWMKDNHVDIPVVILTAAGSEDVAVEAMKLGAYDYIRKERFEIDHLPVVIYNGRENAILKRQNDRMETELREKNFAMSKLFQDTVRTLSHYINNNLATMQLRIQVFKRKTEREVQEWDKEKMQQFLDEIFRDAKMIEAVMKALMSVSNLVYTKYTDDQEIFDIRGELERVLNEIH